MNFKRSTTLILSFFLLAMTANISYGQDRPNILLIIADDLGVDMTNGYHNRALMPTTPTLDSLMSTGITFENVFSAPVCTPTRATIMSGKHGIKTGVMGTPGNLALEHTSIFTALEEQTNGAYSDAVIGKWHISQPLDVLHPAQHNIDYYMGVMEAGVPDYNLWTKRENGVTTTETSYATTVFTDTSISWIQQQSEPWFLWLAHVAPHTPIHTPPSHMYTIGGVGTNYRKYIAMIESVDYEINRLLQSMSEDERNNTLIIYLGDNGTPNNVLQDYPANHGKTTLYQGGIRVPLIISGKGVERQGERESALINLTDIYATILEMTGGVLPGGINNSLSFAHLLKGQPGQSRDYNYMDFASRASSGWTIRNEQYKLIDYEGEQEFYDLLNDSFEVNDLLLGSLTTEQSEIKLDLETEAETRRTSWSCRDHIKNGDEEGIDCGGSFCSPCTPTSVSNNFNQGISIYPNPATDILTIKSDHHDLEEIKIYDSVGKLMIVKNQIYSKNFTIDISQLSSQFYFVEAAFGEWNRTFKIFKTDNK